MHSTAIKSNTVHLSSRLRVLALASLALTCSSPAIAREGICSDILQRGVFDTSRYYREDFLQQIVLSDIARSSDGEKVRSFHSAAGVDYEGVPMSGTGNIDAVDRLRSASVDRLNINTIKSNTLDIALSSGDPAIIKAWSDCVKQTSGTQMRFEILGGKTVRLRLGFYTNLSGMSARISSAPHLDSDVSVQSGGECIKEEAPLLLNQDCVVELRMPDARRSASVSLRTNYDSASAFLPPRVHLVANPDRLPDQITEHLLKQDSDSRGTGPGDEGDLVAIIPPGDFKRGVRFSLEGTQPLVTSRINVGQNEVCRIASPVLVGPDRMVLHYWYRHVQGNDTTCEINLIPGVETTAWSDLPE